MGTSSRSDASTRGPWWLWAAGVLFAVFALALVVASLRRPQPPTFAPTPRRPRPVGDSLVRDRVVTVDARRSDRWVRFDFSRGSAVGGAEGAGWDLAFRRFRMVVNGGPAFPGRGGVVDLGEVPFDSVGSAPARGYAGTERKEGGEPRQATLEDWYQYDFFSHLLSPRPRTYAVRTADGRYAKVRFLSYYCPGTEAGCVTFRYTYRGDGGRGFPGARRLRSGSSRAAAGPGSPSGGSRR